MNKKEMYNRFTAYLENESLWLGDYTEHKKYYGIGYYPDDLGLKPIKDEITQFFKELLPDECVTNFCNFVKEKRLVRLTTDYYCKQPGFFEGITYYNIEDILKYSEEEEEGNYKNDTDNRTEGSNKPS